MADSSDSDSLGNRLARWTRSPELRETLKSALGLPKTAEEAAIRGYQRSISAEKALPHPAISQRRYDALSQRHRQLVQRITIALLLAAPLVVVLGLLVAPVAAKAAIWALLLPVAALIAHDARALRPVDEERHLSLRGGLADAWQDWLAAREQLEALDSASQARAALAVNEARMESLVLALGRAEAQPDHQDTAEHAASREWVYRTAAKAKALAAAEQELEAATQRQVDAGDLQLAPEGDSAALDQALDAARELARGVEDPPR